MKKEVKDKLIEVASFCVCVAVLLAIAYYTGFINGFAPSDFQDAYQKIVYSIKGSAAQNKNDIDLFGINSSNLKRLSAYNGYQPMRIPESVLRGVESTKTWGNVFYSNKKVIFYIYDDNRTDFNNSVTNYVNSNPVGRKYNLVSFPKNRFDSLHLGDVGPSEICNSLEECNAVRQKASDYTSLSEFMKRCGSNMCIINPQLNQFIRLKNKNSGQAVRMIYDLADW